MAKFQSRHRDAQNLNFFFFREKHIGKYLQMDLLVIHWIYFENSSKEKTSPLSKLQFQHFRCDHNIPPSSLQMSNRKNIPRCPILSLILSIWMWFDFFSLSLWRKHLNFRQTKNKICEVMTPCRHRSENTIHSYEHWTSGIEKGTCEYSVYVAETTVRRVVNCQLNKCLILNSILNLYLILHTSPSSCARRDGRRSHR